jgi:ATP-binding cassette subfamily B protein
LSPEDQKKGMWIIALMVFNAMLDFFSVAAFVPLMASVIDPEFSSSNSVLKKIYALFGLTSHSTFVTAIAVVVLLFVLLKNLISLWIAKVKARFAFKIRSELSSRALMSHIQSSFIEFTKTDFTQVLNSITNHPLAFTKNIILSITTIISEALICSFILICVVYYDFRAVILIILILFPMFITFRVRRKNLKKISNDLKTIYPKMLKYSTQIVEGYVEVNAYQKVSYFYQRFERMNRQLTETFIKDQTLQAGTLRLTEVIIAFVMCTLIIYAMVVDLSYQQTLILIGIYAGASFRIVPSVNKILHGWQQIRTNEYLLQEFKIPAFKTSKPLDSNGQNIIFNEAITFKNISFQYPDGPQTLINISMTIRKGDKIAITGKSGEGKTTFLLLLLGFLQPSKGEILVDGKNINDKNAWRKLIGYVPQNPYILDGTIAENIAFGTLPENLDRIKILKLINDLNLSDMIQHLPDGIDTRIGERGAILSGGQRQRLAIARALYADVDILLLDEITNQVHSSMEIDIMNLLDHVTERKKTIIMVTHKIPPRYFNTIYHLEKGQLKEISQA